MNKETFQSLFPVGSHLCRWPMPPMTELKRDMDNLKRHGFNLIKLQDHWAWNEPRQGKYDFSLYEELTDYAATMDLGVYVGLTCEQAPNWLWREYPDCRMLGRNGLPVAYQAQSTLPADGKPGPCFDHPGALKEMTRYITKMVKTVGSRENVVVWNTWQEIGYWPEGLAGQQVCYCDHTLAHFRRWLMARYHDLDNLNARWGSRYADWQDVAPDRGAAGRHGLPHDIEWQTFMANEQMAAVLRARVRAIKEADPFHRPVFAHLGGPDIGSGRDWTYARCQDFLGSSAYPAWGSYHGWDDGRPQPGKPCDRHDALLKEMIHNVGLQFDYLRSSNRPGAQCWAAEFQGGPISTGFQKGRVPDAADIRRWMLTALASGVTGISFWVTRAEIMAAESNGFSLLDSVGDSTPRYEEAARIGAALNKFPKLFSRPNRITAPVAILIDEENSQSCAAMTAGGEHHSYSIRGWHRLLWDAGITVDFLIPADLEERGMEYPALILPFPIALSEKTAEKLCVYVEQGGNLISEAAPGRMNELAFCRRGELDPTMASLFGVRQTSFTMVREPEREERWSPTERSWGEYLEPTILKGINSLEGTELRANVYLQTYEILHGATACLQDGEKICGVANTSGDGKTFLLGTFAGHSGTAYRNENNNRFIQHLFRICGIIPDNLGALRVQRRRNAAYEVLFLTNPASEVVVETLPLSHEKEAIDLFNEKLTMVEGGVSISVDPLDVRVVIIK